VARPTLTTSRARLARRAAILLPAVAIVAATAVPAGAAGASPRDRLRGVAHGSLTGGYGILQFHTDGTARFAVKECGFHPVRPGFVTAFTDCPPETATGKLTITENGFQLRRPDGSAIRFSAYVDTSNQVHLGFGAVGRVAADRTGTVDISPSEQLVVTRTGCRYVQAGAAQLVSCQFVQSSGRTLLLYPAPNAAAQGGTQLAALVYLSGPRLLVSPDMVERIYRRK
jgi:hypothetical protein